MKVWAENCPANYGHKYYIVEAELARLAGNTNNALNFTIKQLNLLKEHEYHLEEAIKRVSGKSFGSPERKIVCKCSPN